MKSDRPSATYEQTEKPLADAVSLRIIEGDCLDIMPGLPSNSVDLICTDPPYHRVKGEEWDRQWPTDADYLAWLDQVLAQFQRLLKPNGSLYLFAGPKMAARIEVLMNERFEILNRIQWIKHDGTENKGGLWSRSNKECLRQFFEQREEIIFAEHPGADSAAKGESGYGAKCDELRGFVFEPIRAYLDGERRRADINFDQVREAVGCRPKSGLPSHWFTKSQWALPTAAHYSSLQRLLNEQGRKPAPPWGDFHSSPRERFERSATDYDYLRADYESLRADYESLRRPFFAHKDAPYTDVWEFATVQAYPGKHPCEKPESLIEHIIRVSSRPGAAVLDAFSGSGVVGRVAKALGREAILIEKDSHWAEVCRQSMRSNLPLRRIIPLKKESPILPLFEGLNA